MSGDGNFSKKLKKYGPWEFKTPQRQMHYKYSNLEDPALRFIAEDNPNIRDCGIRRYWLMDIESLYYTMKRNTKNGIDNCFYELMPSSKCTHSDMTACSKMLQHFGTRAYLDIEFKDPCDWVDYETSEKDPSSIGLEIAKRFHAYVEKHMNCTCELLILKSHRSHKKSWHVIAKMFRDGIEYLFRDSLAVLTLIEAWFADGDVNAYEYVESDKTKNAIDNSVYFRHKLFRIYGNQKLGSDSGPLKWDQYYPASTKNKPNFEDLFVLQSYKNRMMFEVDSSDSCLSKTRNPSKKRKRAQPSFSHGHLALEQFFFGLPAWKDVKECLQRRFPLMDFGLAQFKTIDSVYIPLRTKQCPFNNGSDNGAHRSNHSYLYVYMSSGSCYWFCNDEDCKRKHLKKRIDFPLDVVMKMRSIYQRKKEISVQL
jgi:hypothetical protein